MLEGSGSVTLDGSTDSIVGATGGGILNNISNIISGSGNIGLAGNGLLSLSIPARWKPLPATLSSTPAIPW